MLLDEFWLDGYSIGFVVSALKSILDLEGEDMVRKHCPDITDEILLALKELGTDYTDDEYKLFEKRYEADIMKMKIYDKAYAKAVKALEAKKLKDWRESAVRESARFLKEAQDDDEKCYDDSVPVAIFTEYEEAPIVPSQFGTECPQKTEDRIRLARFFLELMDQSSLSMAELDDFLYPQIIEGENTVICRCKNRVVVIRDNYWTQWRIVYVSPQEPWYIGYYKGRERVRAIELDEYGRLMDEESVGRGQVRLWGKT